MFISRSSLGHLPLIGRWERDAITRIILSSVTGKQLFQILLVPSDLGFQTHLVRNQGEKVQVASCNCVAMATEFRQPMAVIFLDPQFCPPLAESQRTIQLLPNARHWCCPRELKHPSFASQQDRAILCEELLTKLLTFGLQ